MDLNDILDRFNDFRYSIQFTFRAEVNEEFHFLGVRLKKLQNQLKGKFKHCPFESLIQVLLLSSFE